MNPVYTLRSHTNELRLYENHLEGEFIGNEVVSSMGSRFFCLMYSEVDSVVITESPESQMKILEINYAGKPKLEKKHLHPSNMLFRQVRNESLQNCIKVKTLIEYLAHNQYDEKIVQEILGNRNLVNEIPQRGSGTEKEKQSKSFSFYGLL